MIRTDLMGRGIARGCILEAFARVPREAFVPESLAKHAYDDRPLPIGSGQTISQPYIVARTLDALELEGGERILEIGCGSGYAAALLGCIGRDVHTVERVAWLADAARERLSRLKFDNVHVLHGDGTLGWPEHAPYDAIAVAAGGPAIPQSLLDQLAIGGRLVIPVTRADGVGQALVRVRRLDATTYEQEELEDVRFVPLIGAQGHPEEEAHAPVVLGAAQVAAPGAVARAARIVREAATPIADIDRDRFDALVERLAGARVVLFGEATHGTSEFYRMRARLTKELVTRHGFDFVAAEADWPDASRVDDYVLGVAPPRSRVASWTPFERFPSWMWRNREVAEFVEWLRDFNQSVARGGARRGVGFHGLDLYSLYTSLRIVVGYLDDVDPEAASAARERYGRLLPWEQSPEHYGLAVARGRLASSEEAVVATLRDLLRKRLDYVANDGRRFFDAAQNARVVAGAERYYRTMYYGAAESWNLRDSHMFDTLRVLLAAYGTSSKGIVWAHNSHVGDAAATEMRARGEHNIGHLCRRALGDAVRLVGFGTYAGTVCAARDWDEPALRMTVRPGHPESYEHVFHEAGVPAFALALRAPAKQAVREELSPARLFRAIGVVYRPDTELVSHYMQAVLPAAFDELVWFDATTAVTPLEAAAGAPASVGGAEMPETYPFGV